MVATKIEFQQMKQVLDEMNTHPDARLFYALQERGRSGSGSQWLPKMTIGIVTEKVNQQLYSGLSAFVEDMTLIFSDCHHDSSLASGASTLKVLFSEILAKHTNYLDGYNSTPPGRKKRTQRMARFVFKDDGEFESDSDRDFDEFAFASCTDTFELPGEDQAALLELTDEIAAIEAEIQLLKDTKVGLQSDASLPGFSTHTEIDLLRTPAYSLGTSGLFASSVEEGRSALGGQNKKRSRRNTSKPGSESKGNSGKRQRVTKAELLISKEQLLYTITHDLPPKFLEGVIRIVNPSFDPITARDEDLEFDINSLDDEVLLQLQQYVYNSIATPKREVVLQKRKEVPKRKAKKEAPKSRLRNQRKRMTRNSVASATAQKQKKQRKQQQQYVTPMNVKRGFVSSELMRDIFKSEEIVRVKKSVLDEDEDEEVDILD